MNIRDNKAFEFWKNKMGDKKHDIHCGAVIDACICMTVSTNLESNIFIISGWIHDMGKLIDKNNHHKESLKFLDQFLKENIEFVKFRLELEDCILNHRTGCIPKTIYGQVFQVADKVALRNLDWIKFKLKFK